MAHSWMIERLHSATRVLHGDADADFDLLFREDTHHGDYLRFLTRQYGFETPLEAAFATTPNLDLMIDLSERQKAQLITEDLLAMDVGLVELASMPLCLRVPQFRGAAEALGWMYVIERATLADAVIRRHLETRLPKVMREASGYLQAYRGMVGTRWREFGNVLDDVARHPAIAERITEAAMEAFRVHRRWSQNDVHPRTAVAAS